MEFPVQTENHRKKSKLGFTLIELLVAIAIIGILAGVLLPNFMGARERARDSQRKQDLDQIKKALRLYYNDYQGYPPDEDGEIKGCGEAADEVCSWGDEFSAGSGPTVYMKKLPLGPMGEPEYTYEEGADTDSFTLYATLENLSDQEASASQTRCDAGSGSQYVVCAD